MKYLIQNRKPISVFHYFEEICAIPHGSYHEEKLADYLVKFAADRGLFCTRDRVNNVFIKLPASPDDVSDITVRHVRAFGRPLLVRGSVARLTAEDIADA